MNIKQIEELTGMTRANIRFYEGEGLITPNRNRENGYRIYSQEDVDALRKIRLLRLMEVPIEQIRTLQEQEATLTCTLEQQLEKLDRQKEQMTRAQEVARQMIQRKEAYDTMDATMYLNALENGESLEKDVKPKLNLPWRRYWARILDYTIYETIVTGILKIFPRWSSLELLFTIGLMLLVEPLLLSLFATTPGKAVFGIRVMDTEEGKLDYDKALVRTWTVLWEGQALGLPLVSQYFQYKSLTAAEDDQTLPWEWDSELTFRDDKLWRYGVYFMVDILVCAIHVWLAR